MWPPCPCKLANYDRQRDALIKRQAQAAIDQHYGFKMGERFQDRRLSTFRPDEGSKEAYGLASRYAETLKDRLNDGSGIVFWGPNGNGKTHLAAAIYHVARAADESAVFVTVPGLLDRLRESYAGAGRASERELTAPLLQARLLVLDDLGQERGSEWVVEKLFTIINQRYEDRQAILATTNRNPDELAERIGRAAFDRLVGMCRFVEITSESRRWDETPRW